MDIRKARVEASYQDAGREISFRIGPGLDVDLDDVLHEPSGLKVRDVFRADNFEPATEAVAPLESVQSGRRRRE